MTVSDAQRGLADILEELFGRLPERTAPTAHLRHDLGLDSLHLIELFMEIEVRFGIEISDAAIESVQTAAGLSCVIEHLVTQKRNAA